MRRSIWASTFLSFISGLMLLTSPAHGQKSPDVNEILSKFVEKIEADSRYINDNYTHEELRVTNYLKNGVVSQVEEERYFVEKRGAVLFQKLISKNQAKVSNYGFKPKEEIMPVNTSLFDRYNFQLLRNETLDGEQCWVLSLRPKPNFPEKEKIDRVLNNITGEIWVEQKTFSFKRLVGRLLREVEYYSISLGFGVKVKRIEAIIESGKVEGRSIVGKARVELEYAARAAFWSISKHEVVNIYYQNYERRKTQ